MPSTEEDETAMLDALFGPMSLGESAERKDNNDTGESTAISGTTTPTKKLCSACGKESDAVKQCNGCKCVWYCDKKCQNKHRKEHKHECRRVKKVLDERGGKLNLGAEKDLGPLPDLPQQEECPICMRVLPIHPKLCISYACCSKIVCGSCDHLHETWTEKLAAERGQTRTPVVVKCTFCRTTAPEPEEEELALLRKRVEFEDPTALCTLAEYYDKGECGLPVDQTKCIELLHQAAGLGNPSAHFKLGALHHFGEMGLEQNEEEAIKHCKEAAEGGHIIARHNLGHTAYKNGDYVAAMRHWRLSASGGWKGSMKDLIKCFEDGLLRHGDLAETLQAFYRSRGEMRSEDRDQFIEHLKRIGEYREEYDL